MFLVQQNFDVILNLQIVSCLGPLQQLVWSVANDVQIDDLFKVFVLREVRLQVVYDFSVVVGEVGVQGVQVDPALLQVALRVLLYVGDVISNLLQLVLDVAQVYFVLSDVLR